MASAPPTVHAKRLSLSNLPSAALVSVAPLANSALTGFEEANAARVLGIQAPYSPGMLRAILVAFSAVFSVADPLGLVPVYLAMTRGYTPSRRRRTAIVASAAMFVTLIVFATAGPSILRFFGLSLGAFRIAGGILLFLMAVDMLRAQPSLQRTSPEQAAETHEAHDVAIFPLAFPMLAGPGAIANAMMQTAGAETAWQQTAIYIAIGLASFATAVVLLIASRAERRLGKTGLSVLERVMGLMLAAIAVQFIVDGIGDVLPALRVAAHAPSLP